MSTRAFSLPRLARLVIGATCLLGPAAAPVCAATIALGNSGWEVSFDTGGNQSIDFGVSKVDHGFAGGAGAVTFTKWLRYLPGLDSSSVTFRQTSASAVRFIVLADEVIINDSGAEWTGYEKNILGDGTGIFFANTPPGGLSSDGFGDPSLAPFTNGFFSLDQTRYTVDGGTMAKGGIWHPGVGIFSSGGELTIEVSTGDGSDGNPLTEFTLVDRFLTGSGLPIPPPTAVTTYTRNTLSVPEPGALVLVGVGALALGSRRRRTCR